MFGRNVIKTSLFVGLGTYELFEKKKKKKQSILLKVLSGLAILNVSVLPECFIKVYRDSELVKENYPIRPGLNGMTINIFNRVAIYLIHEGAKKVVWREQKNSTTTKLVSDDGFTSIPC